MIPIIVAVGGIVVVCQVKEIAGALLESALRTIIGQRTAGEIPQTQGGLAARWREAATPALAGLGLGILSLSVRDLAISESVCA